MPFQNFLNSNDDELPYGPSEGAQDVVDGKKKEEACKGGEETTKDKKANFESSENKNLVEMVDKCDDVEKKELDLEKEDGNKAEEVHVDDDNDELEDGEVIDTDDEQEVW
jgi:hypothetical protein